MRLATKAGKRDKVSEQSDDENPWFAMNQLKNTDTQDQTDQHVSKNRQRKFHGGDFNCFSPMRKRRK
jgi:hypothetical protein